MIDFRHISVDNISYEKPQQSFINKFFNNGDVYYVKLYKIDLGEGRYRFDTIKIEDTLEKSFKYINNCRFTRYTIFRDGKIINYKIRNQNIYQYVYTTIPKNNLDVIVSDYYLNVDIIDKDKLASLLSVNRNLTLKPIEIRIWLNIRSREINEKVLDYANEDLALIGLKIVGYTKL